MTNKNSNDERQLNSIIEKSTHGSKASSKPKGYVSREAAMESIKRAAATFGVLGVLVGGLVGVGVEKVADNIHEKNLGIEAIDADRRNFQKIIDANTFRVDEKNFGRNYSNIAEALKTYGTAEFDYNVYLFYKSTNREETNSLLNEFEEYSNSKSADDKDNNNTDNYSCLKKYLLEIGKFSNAEDINDEKKFEKALKDWDAENIAREAVDAQFAEKQQELYNDGANLDNSSISNTRGGL